MKEITDHGEDFDEFYNGNEMITVYCACGYSSLDGEIPHELTPYCSSEKELIEKEADKQGREWKKLNERDNLKSPAGGH
ncbi:MAG TPA: hypothetical protein VJ000_01270 [Thermodesulfovibrionia bacterium]|nr:hypothetical protein [Thermodesulfovibrionia bacterium]